MINISENVDRAMNEQWDFWSKIADDYFAKKTMKGAFVKFVIMDWLWDINFAMDEQSMNEEMGGKKEYINYLKSSMLNKKEIIRQVETMYDNDADEIKRRLDNGELDYINDFSHEYYYANGIAVPELNAAD